MDCNARSANHVDKFGLFLQVSLIREPLETAHLLFDDKYSRMYIKLSLSINLPYERQTSVACRYFTLDLRKSLCALVTLTSLFNYQHGLSLTYRQPALMPWSSWFTHRLPEYVL